MIIVYTPEGGEPQRFDAGRLRASEIQIIERTADAAWRDVRDGVQEGAIGAMRVVAYVIQKRTNPTLKLSEFDPFEGELVARLDAREVRDYAEQIFAKYGDEPEDLAEAFGELRDVAADAETCEEIIADVTAPKAPEPAPEPESRPSLNVA